SRYQTVYAGAPGSVAAPTAGLHFDETLLEKIQGLGVKIARVHLHVGLGTFEPVVTEVIEDHPMHRERYQLDQSDADSINQTIERGGRIIAVGTTSVRTLETLAKGNQVVSGAGETNLLITPGYKFKVVDGLITNFHLPRTTLLALVCALGGTERVLAAYRQAIQEKYRFYSYGDAMMIH
ncbi:MAG: S-adenosylmethionine:tRNA ribosyltransferase-isomerase, partial [Planctomycetes bacterium]|nr:S-adenosylmethionine:tRNA ribosyltransferase-isomerase [Planctomycetota bacterium]